MTPTEPARNLNHASAKDVFECLHLLADLIHDFARTLDVEATLRRGIKRIVDQVGAEALSLFLLEEDGESVVCRACFGPVDITGLRLSTDVGIVARSISDLHAELKGRARYPQAASAGVCECWG